ncbi:TPA: hypothetical protein ONC54_002093 [Enterobacter roggenkampii]|nr:hypothetical protein [Enterobacter roggenkampii]
MPTNEFKPFSIAGGANVISQADYEALSALSTGFSSGVAKSNEINKVLRQSTFIAAAIAQFVSDKANVNVMDDGSLSGFITKLVNALNKVSQPLDGTLSALATLTTGDNKLPYFTGTDTASQTDLTSVGRDLIGKGSVSEILQYLGLNDTVDKAKGAVQKTGDEMSGKLTLPQTSSFGVNVNNNIGGSSIAIGDNDTGFMSGGDGIISLIANSVVAGYFSENELQHHGKVLTKIFQAISTGNATEGAGGLGSQLTSGAPFYSPAIVRQNNDNNYFPLWKQIVSLQSGYPVAASMGLLTTGKPNFPQIVLHAKTDFEVNDKLWVFDVASGEFRSPGRLLGTEIFLSGKTRIGSDGNINGEVWGGWLNDYLYNTYNKKNTATLGFSGWSRDESTGLIMQWGNVDKANGTYSFPRAFIDTCFAVFATNKDGQLGAIDNAYGYPVSKTQFRLASKANSGSDTACGISWFALGY